MGIVPSEMAKRFLTRYVANYLRRFSTEDEYERCAVILGGRNIRLHEVENVSEWTEGFAIKKSAVETVLRATEKPLLGYLHTHLPHHKPVPSEDDLADCAKHPDLVYAVYHTASKQLAIYQAMKTYYRLEFVPIGKLTRRK